MLVTAFVAWKTDRRGAPLAAGALLVVCGYAIFVGSSNLNARYVRCVTISGGHWSEPPRLTLVRLPNRYAATFLITMGAFCYGAIVNA